MGAKKTGKSTLGSLLMPLVMLAAVGLVLALLNGGTDSGLVAKVRDSWGQVAASIGVPGSRGAVDSGTGSPSDDPSTLTVAAKGSMDTYVRSSFGPAWTDNVNVEGGHNGCDTRNDILARDLVDVYAPDGCKVLSGTLADAYTGQVIAFVRGTGTSSAVQIDHIVALGNAWVSGADSWPKSRLVMIANDPLNLIASDGPANMGKGDRAADEWLPPNAAFRCTYVKSQVRVKNKYNLTVTAAEKSVMMHYYGQC